MPKIDLLNQHSIFCDYPVWRANVAKHRNRFNKVILYPSDHNREQSFRDFLFETIKEDWVTGHTIDWTAPGVDWRQAETEPMLDHLEGDWVYFNEPDWFVKDYDKFYDAVEKAIAEGADAIGWWNATAFPYLHPACFFIKREILEKTQKDFRAHPEITGCDHFAMLTRDLEKMGAKIVTTEDMGFEYWKDCFHLGGLTSNIIDSVVNPGFEFHRPELFGAYNYFSRKVTPQSSEFIALSEKVEELLRSKYPHLANFDFEKSEWAEFFKV